MRVAFTPMTWIGWGRYILSDCGALDSIYLAYHYAATPHNAVADALNAGGEVCFSVAN